MTERSFPFDVGPGKVYTAAEWRKMMRRVRGSGVRKGMLNQLAVTAGAGLQVLVASGQADVLGEFYENDASKALALEPADGTNPRLDLVVLQLDVRLPADQPTPAITTERVTGAPLPVPVLPGLTQTATIHQVPLYSVAVAAGASSVGAITDYRPWSGDQPRLFTATVTTTTTSTSYVDIASMDSGVFYSDGGDLEVRFSGTGSVNAAGGVINLGVALDAGTEVYLGDIQSDSVSQAVPFSAVHLFENVAAGWHRIRMRWKVVANTGSMTNSRRMVVRECRG
jgi:hypothetical protein